jgi:ferritin
MKLSPALLDLLTAEITRERYADAAYTAIGSWADAQSFLGLAGWADKAATEERGHAQKFIDYVRDRSQGVTLQPVAAPPAEFGDYGGALRAALTLEQTVSAAIGEIYRAAQAEGDGASMELLQWFLTEQVQAEKELEIYVMRVERGAPVDLLDAVLFED